MNMNRDDFYITLFSDASKEIYSLNERTSFTNRLALPVDLGSSSEWSVGLDEISYIPPQRTIINGADVTPIGSENVFVYSDVVAHQLVGSEIKSVLRTIIAPSAKDHHTFPNIYYLPVEKQVLTNIHIELALGNDSRTIMFFDDVDDDTPSKVVLHFRRTKWEMVPAGIEPCTTFLIDKIVDTRSRRGITEVLIKWKGWVSFYIWLPRSYIEKYGHPSKPLQCNAVQ